MFRPLALSGVLILTACVPTRPVSTASRTEALTPASYAVSEKMQEARSFLFSHSELFLTDPTGPGYASVYGQSITMLGREDLMALIPRDDLYHVKQDCSEDLSPALPAIRETAKNHTLVIINESHSRPQHRAFIGEVVDMLRDDGFTHYAAETLSLEGAQQSADPAKVGQGWYIHDPIFARMLERIRDSGMVLVAYEQTEDQRLKDEGATIEEIVAVREEAQAQNLINAILEKAPETRMIIHVGYGHIEEVQGSDVAMMATRLKAKTGIDPFTIDMVYCGETVAEPLLTSKINGRPASEWAGTDVSIRLPKVTFTSNRPDYRRSADTQDIALPADLRPSSGLAIVEARLAGQGDEVIPVDRLLLRSGEDSIPLILPPGDYEVAAFDETGLIAGPVAISVAP